MLTLFTHFNAVCGQKVQLMLDELSLAYTVYPVNLRDSEQHSAWFLKLNPNGQVPVLLDGDLPICESTEICTYLDSKFNNKTHFSDLEHQSDTAKEWLHFIDHEIHTACSLLSWCIAIRPEMLKKTELQIKQHLNAIPCEKQQHDRTKALKLGLNLPELSSALSTFKVLLTKMARLLAQNNYILSDNVSILDIVTLPYIERLTLLSFTPMWQEYPEICQWHQRMTKLKGYQICFHESYPPGFKQRWLGYGEIAKEKLLNLKRS